MQNVINILIGLSILAFLLAVISVLVVSGPIMGVLAEGYSSACSNLALIAISLSVCCKTASTNN
jgi:hypothetical protein